MHVSVSFRQVLRSEHCSCSVCVCSTALATTRKLDDLCVVRPHLGGHFRALDQTCDDIFFLRGFLSGPWEIWTFFLRGLFSGPWEMYVCLFGSPCNSTKTCMCVCLCVCRAAAPRDISFSELRECLCSVSVCVCVCGVQLRHVTYHSVNCASACAVWMASESYMT